jgi:hypothetical protein
VKAVADYQGQDNLYGQYYGFDARRYVIMLYLALVKSSINIKIKLIRRPAQAWRGFHTNFYNGFMELFTLTAPVFKDDVRTDDELAKLFEDIKQWNNAIQKNKRPTPKLIKRGLSLFNRYSKYLSDKQLTKIL